MPRKGYTPEQIIGKLREAEVGARTADLCRKHGMSDATFYMSSRHTQLGACPRIRSWRRKPPRNNLLTALWTLSWSN